MDEDKLKQIKRERAREKAKANREKMKLIELQKKTVEYQKKVNENRSAFGLEKNKIQSSMTTFFKKTS